LARLRVVDETILSGPPAGPIELKDAVEEHRAARKHPYEY